MAMWIIIDPLNGEQIVRGPERETLEFNDGQQAAAVAASFLIPDELSRMTREEVAEIREQILDQIKDLPPSEEEDDDEEEEAEEPEPDIAELHVVCLEYGIRIRMVRDSIEPLT